MDAGLPQFVALAGGTVDPTRGHIGVAVNDCDGAPAAGVSYTLDTADGETLGKADNDEMMGCVAYMTQVCEDVTTFAYRAAGSQGLRNPSIVQRCFRDMMTGALHIFVDRKSYEEHAKNRLGVQPG